MHEGGNVVADVHTPEQRSYNMSRIRGKNTRPEELVRRYLLLKVFVTEKTMLGFQENRISFFQNIRQLFL